MVLPLVVNQEILRHQHQRFRPKHVCGNRPLSKRWLAPGSPGTVGQMFWNGGEGRRATLVSPGSPFHPSLEQGWGTGATTVWSLLINRILCITEPWCKGVLFKSNLESFSHRPSCI